MKKDVGLSLVVWLFLLGSTALGVEKIRYGTSIKLAPVFYLPVIAAEEKGLWKENGLEAEWVPFRGGTDQVQAAAAGVLKIGSISTVTMLQGAAGGLPLLAVADLAPDPVVSLWVRGDSPLKKPMDMKGARVGIFRFGSLLHYNALVAARTLGIEKEVKFVATGGFRENIAALRAGHVQIAAHARSDVVGLWVKGEIRELLNLKDYLPKEWEEDVIFATRDLASQRGDTTRRTVKAVLQAIDFLRRDARWTIEKMKSMSGFSEEAATLLYPDLMEHFTKDGVINKKAMQNVIDFTINYGIIKKERIPPLEQLFTNQFLERR